VRLLILGTLLVTAAAGCGREGTHAASPGAASTTIAVGTSPSDIALNEVTGKAYVANYFSGDVTVIDTASNETTTVRTGGEPEAAAVDAHTNRVYVTSYPTPTGPPGPMPGVGNDLTVIDGATNVATPLELAAGAGALVVNSANDKVYVSHFTGGNITVVDGPTNVTSTIAVGGGGALAVNPVTNKVYVGTGNGLAVIDGATNATATWRVDNGPRALAVDSRTGKVYVSNGGKAGPVRSGPGAYTVTVFDPNRGPVPTVIRDTCLPSPSPGVTPLHPNCSRPVADDPSLK